MTPGLHFPTYEQPQFRAELLKERIYATLAVLAVLLSVDPLHTSYLRATLTVGGTTVSLWAASLVSTRIANRVVLAEHQPHQTWRYQLTKHAPLLLAAAWPLLCIGLSSVSFLSLELAINLATAGLLLELLGWSVQAARALKFTGLATLVVAAIELGIGLAVVMLKIIINH